MEHIIKDIFSNLRSYRIIFFFNNDFPLNKFFSYFKNFYWLKRGKKNIWIFNWEIFQKIKRLKKFFSYYLYKKNMFNLPKFVCCIIYTIFLMIYHDYLWTKTDTFEIRNEIWCQICYVLFKKKFGMTLRKHYCSYNITYFYNLITFEHSICCFEPIYYHCILFEYNECCVEYLTVWIFLKLSFNKKKLNKFEMNCSRCEYDRLKIQ